ncbi:MAG: acyltransferase family protein [Prevotellaceae bacterium]|nr:acyltransferase family protein [Prevotellaceae bacterium]
MEKVRDSRWDFYRAILAFGVILGHTINALKCSNELSSWLYTFIRSYDMPMFAFISGVFLYKSAKRHSFFTNLANKIFGILIPALIWTLVLNCFYGEFKLDYTHFWFLWSLFFCSAIVLAIDAVCVRYNGIKAFMLVALCILFNTVIDDPWFIGFLLVPCVVGYYYEDIKRLVDKVRIQSFILKTGIVIIFIVMECFWSTDYSIWNIGCNMFAFGTPMITGIQIVFRTVLGVTGCFVMKLFIDFIYRNLSQSSSKYATRILAGGGITGQCTLEIYILQCLLVENFGATCISVILRYLGYNPFTFNMNFLQLVIAPVIAVVAFIVAYFLQKYIKKIPFVGKFVFGFSMRDIKREVKNV